MNWYAARPNEIFCDIDSKKNLLRALRVIRAAMIDRENDVRLKVAKRTRLLLDVNSVYYYPTSRPGHGHLIVTLNQSIGGKTRAVWELWLGSDRLRSCYVLQRILEGLTYADLLVSSGVYHREPDDSCQCKGKHKTKSITDNCPALKRLLGAHRSADYFPRVGTTSRIKPLRVPIGKISKTTLIRWKGKR